MAEKFIEFKDVRKGRYKVSDEGFVYDTKSNKVMSVRTGCVFLKTTSKTTRERGVGLGKLMMLSFKDPPQFDPYSDFVWVAHRNGDPDDFRIDNLYWALFKSEIRIEDVYKIYDMLKRGITDSVEIGRYIGMYVPDSFVRRLYQASRAEKIAEFLNVDYEAIPNRRHFNTRPQAGFRLTNEQVIEICEALVKFGGDSRKVADSLQFVNISQVRAIAYKKTHASISDKYFKDYKILQQEYQYHPNDTDDEKWKIVPDRLLFPQAKGRIIYVSTKGRFISDTGYEFNPYDYGHAGILHVAINGKAHLCSRLILATHSLDLPNLLNFPYTAFSIKYKDENKNNLNVENLYWAPRYSFKRMKSNNVDLKLLNKLSVYLKNATDSDKGAELRNECYKIINNYEKNLKITSGRSYAYYTRNFASLEWRRCTNIDGEYYVSNNGIVRHKEMTMLTTHSSIDDERNYVTINNTEFLVCKLVLKAFKPLTDYTNYFPCHIDGDLKNDNVDNLKWKYLSPESSIGKHKWKSHIKEKGVPIDWLKDVDPTRFILYNTGRVFDNFKNKWMQAHYHSNGAKYVTLRTINKTGKLFYVAMNVIRCFKPEINIENYVQGNRSSINIIYKDGDRNNCTYKNLSVELKHNILPKNIVEEICLSIVSENGDIDKVVENIHTKFEILISNRVVCDIKSGRRYKDISRNYFHDDEFKCTSGRYQKVNKLSIDGLIITEYESIEDCLSDNPFIEYHGLRDHASPNGERYKKPYKGFRWEYV